MSRRAWARRNGRFCDPGCSGVSLLALDESKAQVLNMEDRLIEQVRDMRVMEGVDDTPPAPLADNEPEVAQDAKLVRDGGTFHLNR